MIVHLFQPSEASGGDRSKVHALWVVDKAEIRVSFEGGWVRT